MPDYKKQFNLEKRVATLQPGDILLKRNLDGFKSDPLGNIISFMQMVTVSSGTNLPGAYVSGHAAIYIGNDRIAEANGHGVVITQLDGDVKHVRYIVYRHSNHDTAQIAAEIAEILCTRRRVARKWSWLKLKKVKTQVDGKYSAGRAALSLLNPRQKGRLGMGDQLIEDVFEIYTNRESNLVTPNFFCSMFVYTVYEVASQDNEKFNYDPYSIDPKFYHKILETRKGLYTKEGKYIHAVSETVMERECYQSVKEAIASYGRKRRNQSFKSLRRQSLETENALKILNQFVLECDNNQGNPDHYQALIVAGLYYTRSISEVRKIFPHMAQNEQDWQSELENLRGMFGAPLREGSTLLAELDKTSFFKRLRSVRKA